MKHLLRRSVNASMGQSSLQRHLDRMAKEKQEKEKLTVITNSATFEGGAKHITPVNFETTFRRLSVIHIKQYEYRIRLYSKQS